MSLITQCPACATMFRVVPDQLRISEGWVRCGQCDEVFDANAHLQTWNPQPAVPAAPAVLDTPAPAYAAEVPAAYSPGHADAVPYDWGPLAGDSPVPATDASFPPVPQTDASVEPVATLEGDGPHQRFEPDYSIEADPFLSQSPQHVPVAEESVDEQLAAVPLEMRVPAEDSPSVDTAQSAEDAVPNEMPLSFMRGSDPSSRAGRWPGTPWWIAGSAVLTALLGLQIVVVERNYLAAAFPVASPVLKGACDLLGCTISPPRQIEAIAIDSSAFNSIKTGVYMLHVTLKNTAPLVLESPALELTLTDMQDQPLLRRVIPTSEYASHQATMAASGEMTLDLPVSVHTGAALEKIAGYKLLAFYP